METLIAVMVFAAVLAVWHYRRMKKQDEYDKQYRRLEMYVRHSLLSKQDYEFISAKFEILEKSRYKDTEKLSVLWGEFNQRYKQYINT